MIMNPVFLQTVEWFQVCLFTMLRNVKVVRTHERNPLYKSTDMSSNVKLRNIKSPKQAPNHVRNIKRFPHELQNMLRTQTEIYLRRDTRYVKHKYIVHMKHSFKNRGKVHKNEVVIHKETSRR